MKEFVLGIADLKILVKYENDGIEEACYKFKVENCDRTDFSVSVTQEEIDEEIKQGSATALDAEFLCIYRAIAEKLPERNRFVFHGSAISFDDVCYIFTAKSGTGKSTHTRLWKECFGKHVKPVNGDKPILYRKRGVWYACGTPWAGKECWTRNIVMPIGAIAVLNRNKKNSIHRLLPKGAVVGVLTQIYVPSSHTPLVRQLDLTDKLVTEVPIYDFYCDISRDAVRCSFEKMTGLNFDEYEIPEEENTL